MENEIDEFEGEGVFNYHRLVTFIIDKTTGSFEFKSLDDLCSEAKTKFGWRSEKLKEKFLYILNECEGISFSADLWMHHVLQIPVNNRLLERIESDQERGGIGLIGDDGCIVGYHVSDGTLRIGEPDDSKIDQFLHGSQTSADVVNDYKEWRRNHCTGLVKMSDIAERIEKRMSQQRESLLNDSSTQYDSTRETSSPAPPSPKSSAVHSSETSPIMRSSIDHSDDTSLQTSSQFPSSPVSSAQSSSTRVFHDGRSSTVSNSNECKNSSSMKRNLASNESSTSSVTRVHPKTPAISAKTFWSRLDELFYWAQSLTRFQKEIKTKMNSAILGTFIQSTSLNLSMINCLLRVNFASCIKDEDGVSLYKLVTCLEMLMMELDIPENPTTGGLFANVMSKYANDNISKISCESAEKALSALFRIG